MIKQQISSLTFGFGFESEENLRVSHHTAPITIQSVLNSTLRLILPTQYKLNQTLRNQFLQIVVFYDFLTVEELVHLEESFQCAKVLRRHSILRK
jgi:hypothetical protein